MLPDSTLTRPSDQTSHIDFGPASLDDRVPATPTRGETGWRQQRILSPDEVTAGDTVLRAKAVQLAAMVSSVALPLLRRRP